MICTSIPARDGTTLARDSAMAFSEGSDLVEIRFDYSRIDALNDLLEAVMDKRERMIFTCRAKGEGGMFEGDEHERLMMLKRLASFRPMLLDVEYSSVEQNEEFHEHLRALNCDLLISRHDFSHTPSMDRLREMVGEMLRYGSRYVKIVTMAQSLDDNLSILSLYDMVRGSSTRLVAFCMGRYGLASRVLCTLFGAPFTYAALDEPLAPSQLTLRQMRKIYKVLHDEGYTSRIRNDKDTIVAVAGLVNSILQDMHVRG